MSWFRRRSDAERFREIDEYRDLLQAPGTYEEGFTMRTIVGALFIAVVMVPGNMYLSLMIGGSIGAAAEWVTVILFIEIAKRSFTTLKRQEIYLLLYVATALIASESGAFSGLLWNQYFVQSPAAHQFGVARYIPWWVSPQAESQAIVERTFLHADWFMPIVLLITGMIVGKVGSFTGGYFLFRVTSDYERLPFPFAPIAAQGAMALAEESSGEHGWRWRVFSIGAAIGVAFGAVYVALPAVTGVLMTQPVTLLPIPWVDLTQYTGYLLPATPLGFTCHLGPIFAGLVAPFWGIVGAFFGVIVHTAANPILHRYGLLPHWFEGMDTIQTQFVNSIDFWMSFGIGITIALTVIGIWQVVRGVHGSDGEGREKQRLLTPPPGRGDFRLAVILGLFALTSVYPIILAKIFFPELVGSFLIGLFFFFAFVYTPIISFINARLIGMVGMTVSIPYIRESIIFLSGYRGVDIWFVPMGIGDYSGNVQKFREIELSGTRFTSFVKAELFMVPLVLVMGLLYSSLLWKMAPIPSPSYPYINTMWPLQALQQSIWLSSTLRGELRVDAEQASWEPGNLQDRSWWYWRARVRTADGRTGPWTDTGSFYTDWDDAGLPAVDWRSPPERPPPPAAVDPGLRLLRKAPADSVAVRTPTPALSVAAAGDLRLAEVEVEFEVDTTPTFDSVSLQTSRDEPILFEALKPLVIAAGLTVGLGMFALLSFFGLPVLFVFGYVRAMNQIPHLMITEILGALLARFYFWKKYGRQQWRLYATVLAVGFSVGMGLMGMISVAFAMIQKAVNVLAY